MKYISYCTNDQEIKNFIDNLKSHKENCNSCQWITSGSCKCDCQECQKIMMQYLVLTTYYQETNQTKTRIEIHSSAHVSHNKEGHNFKELYKNCDHKCQWMFYDDYQKLVQYIK